MSGRVPFCLLILAVLVTVVGGWFILNQEPDHPLSRRNYSRITAGMTRADVEAVLGGPPGAVGQGPKETFFAALVQQTGPVDSYGGLRGKPEIWSNDRGQIVVMFDSWDESARVVGKQLYRPAPER